MSDEEVVISDLEAVVFAEAAEEEDVVQGVPQWTLEEVGISDRECHQDVVVMVAAEEETDRDVAGAAVTVIRVALVLGIEGAEEVVVEEEGMKSETEKRRRRRRKRRSPARIWTVNTRRSC